MTTMHREKYFEDEICQHLATHDWHYDANDAQHYDRALALYPADVVAWLQATQPDVWRTIQNNHGAHAATHVCQQVRNAIDRSTTIDVLRHGITMVGVRTTLKLAQFKPALPTPDIMARYQHNRLRVIRQVHYSRVNEQSIDLVLFLNGIPIATAELKSDFTQGIDDAVVQYCRDRNPKNEPLLHHLRGAVVHFAVSHSEVRMTTTLAGERTQFLPFNRGDQGGAGNPLDARGAATSYLWHDIWQRDSWLEIMGRYVVVARNSKHEPSHVIFPRYHQLDATRKLVGAVLRDGTGHKYLIQHSAGSGKTNSIAWTAHFLADLHDASGRKIFNSVLVISDRNVIDAQLRDAIESFERQQGVVTSITGIDGSKSNELTEALSSDKKIVVCTIQTFPFAMEEVRRLAATAGKRFAVIADEAHSSQTGSAASKLRSVLSDSEQADIADGGEISLDDLLVAEMSAQVGAQGLTFVAFTATPKAKTIELFGTRPDPTRPASADNVPQAFHIYSMRQAIEEKFILDVLQNYLPYSLAFQLTHLRPNQDSSEVEKNAAKKRLIGWVRLHEHNIAQKVEIVVEHYRTHVQQLLHGQAKAMVVVASRKEAVRWKKAIDHYIVRMRYPIGTLVAFSGEVTDADSFAEAVSETSVVLNPQLRRRDIREAFNDSENHILLVANKFQTGFDQPKLCAMYIDKRIAGIQAVQTLSRLNRAAPGKDTTYIVDFVNQGEEILKAFQTYYQTAQLNGVSDPQLVVDLFNKLDSGGFYDQFEVDRVVNAVYDPHGGQRVLINAVQPVGQRLISRYKIATQQVRAAQQAGYVDQVAMTERSHLELMRSDMQSYVRLYTFLAQMIDFGNPEFHKRMIFYRFLIPMLVFERDETHIDLSYVELTAYNLRPLQETPLPLIAADGTLDPAAAIGTGALSDAEKLRLAEIIRMVNDLFKGDLTEGDMLTYVNEVIKRKLLENDLLRQQAQHNSREQFAHSPDLHNSLNDAIVNALQAHETMSRQALNDPNVLRGLLRILLGPARLYEALRDKQIHTDIRFPT